MQSLRGREQATETRLYLSGDRHAVRRVLDDKTKECQDHLDACLAEDAKLEKQIKQLLEEDAPGEARTKKLADLRYQRTIMTARIASAKRELEKAENSAAEFERRVKK